MTEVNRLIGKLYPTNEGPCKDCGAQNSRRVAIQMKTLEPYFICYDICYDCIRCGDCGGKKGLGYIWYFDCELFCEFCAYKYKISENK